MVDEAEFWSLGLPLDKKKSGPLKTLSLVNVLILYPLPPYPTRYHTK